MTSLDDLFIKIEHRVQEQQEQDEWEALAQAQFPGLYRTLVNHITALLKPLEVRLAKYTSSSAEKVWHVEETSDRFKVRFGDRELSFRPVGQEAKQPGDRFTVRILRKNEELVGRYVLQAMQDGSTEMHWTVLVQGTRAERLDDRHLSQLFVKELLGD